MLWKSPHDNSLTDTLRARFAVYAAQSLYRFEGEGGVREILHRIKYDDDEKLALGLGKQLGRQILQSNAALPDCLVPVPLHPNKLKKRGFNQSERLARGIASAIDIPVEDNLLIRKGDQSSQTKLGRMHRWENISEAFDLKNSLRPGVHIGIVDDMITTGSTLEACALLLKDHTISVFSFAFEP